MSSENHTQSSSMDSRSLPRSRDASEGVASRSVVEPTALSSARATELSRVGRYHVRRQLGVGGMGVVYEGYDPELDRLVAIKLVRPRSSRRGDVKFQRRLLREGKAMARLSHPNVVAVHDVGIVEQTVFVAMELVDGPTLKAWLGAQPRGWRATLDMFIGAGRGLAAAHAAGLVHRDFKPSNVLVDAEGRPRIADFGLVRMGEIELESRAATEEDERAGELRLTRDGARLGTPLYMSPEQHGGAEVDARSDQFSFCVALWEGLFAEHPFAGESADALVDSVAAGARREPGAGAAVPRYIRAALDRGLARDPAARWGSMEDLLARLDRRPVSLGARVAWTSAALAAGAAVVAGVAMQRRGAAARPCADIDALIEVVWSASRGEALTRSIAAVTVADPREFPEVVRPALDAYAAGWVEGYTQECEAHARGERSARRYDHAVRCFEDRRTSLEAVVSALESGDRRVIAQGPAIAAGLPALERCADPPAAGLETLDPPGPEVQRLREAVLRLHPLVTGGAVGAARDELDAMREEVDALNDPRLTSAYYRLAADLLRLLGREEEGHAAYQRVLDECLRVEDARCAAQAASQLVWKIRQPSMAESKAYARIARTMMEKAGLEGSDLALLLDYHVAKAGDRFGPEQWAQIEQIVDRIESTSGTDPALRVKLLSEAARFALDAGRPARATAWIELALARARATLGGSNPALIRLLTTAARYHVVLGDFDAAAALASEALRIAELFDPEGMEVVRSLNMRAIPREQLGDFEGALADLERAGRLLAAQAGALDSAAFHFNTKNSIAVILDRVGRHAEAEARLLALLEEIDQEREPIPWNSVQLTLADVELHLGAARAADDRYAQTGAWFASYYDDAHPMALYAETGRGLAALARGDVDVAIERLERCLKLHGENPGAPTDLARTKLGLARALWSRRAARPRARDLAQEAAEFYASAGPGFRRELAAAERWLSERARAK